jgi:hypothetical protein
VVKGKQLRFFYTDKVLDEFEKMMKLVLRKSSIEIIRNYYETEYVYEMDDLDDLHRMIIKDGVKGAKSPRSYDELPKVIYIRPSVLDAAITDNKSIEGLGQL